MELVQGTLDDLGTALSDVTFVVVDLETTGGSASADAITEIGAVKTRGGEVLGEFQTFVNPGRPIPAFIAQLTGITDAVVADAPRIAAALPAFLEFAGDAVLVAHNAGFDITFLRRACERLDIPWHRPTVVDTVLLARHLVPRDECRNHKLSSLAALFGATTTPDHRALHDARATVDVLHALIGRVGNQGVRTLEELTSYTSRVAPQTRRKRVLAEHLPHEPGVYRFVDAHERVLYVGTSKDIRTRVRSYFTASEQRTRMAQMVALAERVVPIVCQTPLEAQVRELRLIAEHRPRFNRRSKDPQRAVWITLTGERFPRLSIVRTRPEGVAYAGPFASRASAQAAVDAIHEVVPLRQCSRRIGTRTTGSACVLAEMGRCGAPCTGAQDVDDYARVAQQARQLLLGVGRVPLDELRDRLEELAAHERFEDAAVVRDRVLQLVRGLARAQRLEPVRVSASIMAARPLAAGGWEVVAIRHGRFAGTVVTPRGASPMPYIDTLRATAEVVTAQTETLVEESEILLRWLEQPGVRLVELDGSWSCPVAGAELSRRRLEPRASLWRQDGGFDDDRTWQPRATPATASTDRLGA